MSHRYLLAVIILLLSCCLFAQRRPTIAQGEKTILLRQWANSASATSQYSATSWNATQAAGSPNVKQCGDNAQAWAALNSDTKEQLTLRYEVPVIPRQINIYETYNPGAIVGVALIPVGTTTAIKLPNSASTQQECPGLFTINIADITKPVQRIVIDLDQSKVSSWSEIDAVELVGYAEPGTRLSQWAEKAVASSEYTDSSWGALQATGPATVQGCGDNELAWASRESTTIETLTLSFGNSVIPEEIRIFQTYNPGAITRVEVVPTDGSAPITLANSANRVQTCPFIFRLKISDFSKPVSGVIIHLDQSLTHDWSEIDAVQLVGHLPNTALP